MIRSALLSLLLSVFSLSGCDPKSNQPTPPQPELFGDTEVEIGNAMFNQQRYAESITHLEGALNKPLKNYTKSLVLTMVGNSYSEMNQLEKAIEYHDRSISEDPQNHKAYVNRGIVYRLMGDYEKASESYSKALQIAPNYAELHASMGALLITQELYDRAITHLELAVKLDDSLAVAHSNLALAYACVDRFDEADSKLKKATLLGYRNSDIMRERIDSLRRISEAR